MGVISFNIDKYLIIDKHLVEKNIFANFCDIYSSNKLIPEVFR